MKRTKTKTQANGVKYAPKARTQPERFENWLGRNIVALDILGGLESRGSQKARDAAKRLAKMAYSAGLRARYRKTLETDMGEVIDRHLWENGAVRRAIYKAFEGVKVMEILQ